MNINKKPINLAILLLTLILILSTISYAKPFTDTFTGGLIQINDFFTKEQYKTYATAIDFFFFALLFISVYMIGVRYAFKEVKKPEKVIAILLGLMTAFLLVLGGFSATILLPYIAWILYILLFILIWHLLKGIKSKFWRFVLALLLTLLIIGLAQWLFDSFKAPDTEGFFKSLGKSFGSIKFPEIGVPGVPDYLSNLFGAPAAPTGPDLTTLPSAITPTEVKKEGWLPGGYSTWHLIWVLPFLALAGWGIKKGVGKLRRKQPSTIINEITEIINKKTAKMNEVNQANQEKKQMIQAGENIETMIRNLRDPSYSWEAVRNYQEGHSLKVLYNKELQLVTKLKELMDLEKTEFLETKLVNWQERIQRETGIDDARKQRIVQQLDELRNWVKHKTTIRDIRNMGILWLIVVCYDFEKREAKLNKELDQLLQEHNVEKLIRDKFAKVKDDNKKLLTYNSNETFIIKILNQKIELQKSKLEELKGIISGQAPPTQPPVQPTPAPTPPTPTPTTAPAAPGAPGAPAPAAPVTSTLSKALTPAHVKLKIEQPSPNSSYTIGNEISDLNVRVDGSLDELMKIFGVLFYHWSLTGFGINDIPIRDHPIAIQFIKPNEKTNKYRILEIFTEQEYATLKVRLIGRINKRNNILGEDEINIKLVKPSEEVTPPPPPVPLPISPSPAEPDRGAELRYLADTLKNKKLKPGEKGAIDRLLGEE